MSITLTNNFDGGTNGVVISTTNSGGTSGNAFDAVDITSGTAAFDSTYAATGTLSGLLSIGSSFNVGSYVQWSTSLGSQSGQLWFRVYLYVTSITSGMYPVFLLFLSGGNRVGGIQLNGDTGVITFADGANLSTAWLTSTTAMPANQWVRFEGYIVPSTTAGEVALDIYLSDQSTTPTESLGPATGLNTNYATVDTAQFGQPLVPGTVSATYSMWQDSIGLSTAGALGPDNSATSVPLADSGAAADTALVSAPASLGDAGSGVDSMLRSIVAPSAVNLGKHNMATQQWGTFRHITWS